MEEEEGVKEEEEAVRELRRVVGENGGNVGRNGNRVEGWLKGFYVGREVAKLIDVMGRVKTGVKLYWLEELRFLEELNLKFNFKEIFTFDFLKEPNNQLAFELI